MYIMTHMYHLQVVVHLFTVQAVPCNTKSLLMKTRWNRRPSERTKRDKKKEK